MYQVTSSYCRKGKSRIYVSDTGYGCIDYCIRKSRDRAVVCVYDMETLIDYGPRLLEIKYFYK